MVALRHWVPWRELPRVYGMGYYWERNSVASICLVDRKEYYWEQNLVAWTHLVDRMVPY